jgi:putative transposase
MVKPRTTPTGKCSSSTIHTWPIHFGWPIHARFLRMSGEPSSREAAAQFHQPKPPALPSPHSQRPAPIPNHRPRPLHHLHLLPQTSLPEHARTVFEQTLKTLRLRHGFFVFGYVLMPNHVHLLLSEPQHHLLADTLRALKTKTSKSLKQDLPHFCQRRYYDRNIITQPEFVEKLRYIHRNPVAQGLVEQPEAWPWSSYRHWLTGEAGRVEIESHRTWTVRETLPATPFIAINRDEWATRASHTSKASSCSSRSRSPRRFHSMRRHDRLPPDHRCRTSHTPPSFA